ncbi:MAG: hypothetical protein JWQ96_2989 [Segetibacter sp.]|nr:hypothetical protein [Segetibacter sp.]
MGLLRKLFAKIIQFFPYHLRFKVTVITSFFLNVAFAVITPFQKDKKELYEREGGPTSLARCLRTLVLHDVLFKPKLKIDKKEIFQSFNSGKGLLFAGFHNNFTYLLIPYIKSIGLNPIVIGYYKETTVLDYTFKHQIQIDSTFLLRTRNHLRNGQVVAGMVDQIHSIPKRTREYNTKFGKMHIADALFRVAANTHSEILFVKYKITSRHILFTLGKPCSKKSSHQQITSDFVRFLQG